MFQRILVPLDGSERAELALPLAMNLARIWGGTLFLGRAIEQSSGAGKHSSSADVSSPSKSGDQEEAEALAYLAGKAAQSARTGIRVHPVVVSGAPASALLEMVRRKQIDLVVMCNRGLTGIKRRALGSVVWRSESPGNARFRCCSCYCSIGQACLLLPALHALISRMDYQHREMNVWRTRSVMFPSAHFWLSVESQVVITITSHVRNGF